MLILKSLILKLIKQRYKSNQGLFKYLVILFWPLPDPLLPSVIMCDHFTNPPPPMCITRYLNEPKCHIIFLTILKVLVLGLPDPPRESPDPPWDTSDPPREARTLPRIPLTFPGTLASKEGSSCTTLLINKKTLDLPIC